MNVIPTKLYFDCFFLFCYSLYNKLTNHILGINLNDQIVSFHFIIDRFIMSIVVSCSCLCYLFLICLSFFVFFPPFYFFYPMLPVFLDCPFIDFTGMSSINGNEALNLNAPFPKDHAQWIKQEMYSDVNLHINILPSFMTYTPLFCSTTIRFPHFYHS